MAPCRPKNAPTLCSVVHPPEHSVRPLGTEESHQRRSHPSSTMSLIVVLLRRLYCWHCQINCLWPKQDHCIGMAPTGKREAPAKSGYIVLSNTPYFRCLRSLFLALEASKQSTMVTRNANKLIALPPPWRKKRLPGATITAHDYESNYLTV